MTRRTLTLAALAVTLALCAGPEAWARLLWRAGAPGLALPLLSDPAARGAALYELGRYDEADATFAAVGRSATYDRGLSLAMTGRHALSVAYFDAFLFANPFDAEAHQNRDAVSALVVPVIGEAMGHGSIRTILAEDGVETEAFDPDNPAQSILSEDHDPERRSIKRPVRNERTLAAGMAWLDTLADAPGEYLRERLAAEMDRRRATDTAAPTEASRW